MAASSRRKLLLGLLGVALLRAQRRKKQQEKKRRTRLWTRELFKPGEEGDYEHLLKKLENDRELHFRYLRMSKERFEHLLSLVEPVIMKNDTNFRKAIPAKKRLVITLRFLASGMSQFDISLSFRVGRSTVSGIISKTCDAIYEVLTPLYMRPPNTEEEWKKISQDFEERWNFPHVVGAIDGKHVAIECPKKSGTLYHNNKGFFSMVLLAVYDAKYNFSIIDIGQYGSLNDSAAFLNSELGKGFISSTVHLPQPQSAEEAIPDS